MLLALVGVIDGVKPVMSPLSCAFVILAEKVSVLYACTTCRILPAVAVVAIVPSASPGYLSVLSAAGLELCAANITPLPPLCNNLI